MDEALEDEGLLHVDEKNLLISQHGIPSIIFMSFSTICIQLKCTFFKNEVQLNISELPKILVITLLGERHDWKSNAKGTLCQKW